MENNYLGKDYYFDYDHPAIQKIIEAFTSERLTATEKAAGLYLKIRDGWRYFPYYIGFERKHYQASLIAAKKKAHCIEKSILLIAGLRGLGIPARLRLAKVKNHIAVERLEEKFGTNVMTPHGMVDIFLDGRWLKASPAFNAELCHKCNVAPLEFSGDADSIFQEYNSEGKAFMEYLEDYGHFPDVPVDFILQNMLDHYPPLAKLLESGQVLELQKLLKE